MTARDKKRGIFVFAGLTIASLVVPMPWTTSLQVAPPVVVPGESADLVFYRKMADQGDAGAMHLLGRMYFAGALIPQNLAEAHKWFNLATAGASTENYRAYAERRATTAQAMAPQEVLAAQVRAREWLAAFEKRTTAATALSADDDILSLRERADAGNAEAQFTLALQFDVGPRGLLQDYQLATFWYRKSADQGYPRAQHDLGVRYVTGLGITPDDAQAVVWFRKSADQGNAEAQYELGMRTLNGWGVPQDEAKALALFRKAALVRDAQAQAQYERGVAFLSGRGAPRDRAQALAWFLKAAERGEPQAQYQLGKMYQNGEGVPRDFVEAFKWFSLASRFAYPGLLIFAVAGRDAVAPSLTAQQIAEVQALELQWMAAFKDPTK